MQSSKKIVSVFLSLLMVLSLFAGIGVPAVAETKGVLTYEILEDGTLKITGCDRSASGELVIPDAIDGYPVTEIDSLAFYQCSELTSVTIPDGVTSIGTAAFEDCTSLTSIDIPDSVTSIGEYAFESCISLTSVKIPKGIETIPMRAFYWCPSLTSVEIPAGVTSIGTAAFYGCTSLTSVEISDSVTSIGQYAFYGCTSLTGIEISKNVTDIGDWAFCKCSSLTGITVDSENAYYSSDENGVFFNKEKTVLIQYPLGNERTAYTIPDAVTRIYYEAFADCVSLKSVEIPSSATNISDEAFCACASLTSVTIPDSVTSIGRAAFADCDSLTDVYFTGTPEQWKAITIDDYYNDAVLSAKIHFHETDAVVSEETPATCTENGVITYRYAICGDVSATEEIPATGHTWGEWTLVTAPTCTEDGEEARVCSVCQEEETRTVAALGHVDEDGDGFCDRDGVALDDGKNNGDTDSGDTENSNTDNRYPVSIDVFRCKMCNTYEALKDIPVVGAIYTLVHFFVHLAHYISYLT